MKIQQTQTAIQCFHSRVQSDKHGQYEKILSVMQPYIYYTGQELSHLTGFPPNIISARLFEMREMEPPMITRPDDIKRICPHSHVNVHVHYKTAKQLELA